MLSEIKRLPVSHRRFCLQAACERQLLTAALFVFLFAHHTLTAHPHAAFPLSMFCLHLGNIRAAVDVNALTDCLIGLIQLITFIPALLSVYCVMFKI